MAVDCLLSTSNYEVALLPKMWAVPRAERNFIIQSKQKIARDDMDHPVKETALSTNIAGFETFLNIKLGSSDYHRHA